MKSFEMARHRILILGAGTRVRSDLLPILNHLGFTGSEVLIIRNSNNQLIDFPEYRCAQFDPKLVRKFDPTLVISCLPTPITVEVIEKVLKASSPSNLFVDTPITKIYNKLNCLKAKVAIRVLEDNHLVFFANQLSHSKDEPCAVLVLNALYDYHGVAMISKAFGKISNNFFKIRIRNFMFLIFKSGSRTVFWVGPRNYSKGKIYYLKRGFYKGNIGKFKFQNDSISDWAIAYIIKNFDITDAQNILSSDPIKFMPFWKKMALGEALHKFFLNGENEFIALDEAFMNEIYFQR